ncbi:conserved membrane protein of unknown function [Hyphomicrobium sp. 1Nfss2.1]|uniref:hypothetical protein n=1 Tax=Hyphomicrobium sp. 1Nfss2.1 TaxID=3413936 RepID=UPI003C7BAFA1
MGSTRGLFIGAYVFAGLTAIVLWLADRALLAESGLEDHFAENATAALYLAASLLVLGAYVSSRTQPAKFFGRDTVGNLWLPLLAIFFFVCFGEEVSWGQRVFGWGTPDAWKEVNGHHETNLHNLLDNAQLGTLRILTVIALGYGVLVPLADRYWPWGRRTIAWFGMPVPPLEAAGLFVMVFIAYRVLVVVYPPLDSPYGKPIREYHEAGYAAAFLVISFSLFLDYWGFNRRN